MKTWLILGLLVAPAAFGAPRLDKLDVNPNPAKFAGDRAPEVQVVVSVQRPKSGPTGCEASVDFGDGARPSPEDYGMSSTRSFRHVYAKSGTYAITVRGTGKVPCEGALKASLTVTGEPAKKKAEEKKKAEAKKKAETKKKPEPKKKGAEAPPSQSR